MAPKQVSDFVDFVLHSDFDSFKDKISTAPSMLACLATYKTLTGTTAAMATHDTEVLEGVSMKSLIVKERWLEDYINKRFEDTQITIDIEA